jgi:hypothetical protein
MKIYTDNFYSTYGADYVERQASRQNGIITDCNPRYWRNVCGLTSGSAFIEENDIAIGSASSFIHSKSPTIFVVKISLLSSEECTLVLLHKPCSALRATVQLCETNIPVSALRALWPTHTHSPHPKKNMQAYLILRHGSVPEKLWARSNTWGVKVDSM